MKKIVLLALLFCGIMNAQVFTGKGDQKFQVGANLQDHGTGISLTYDHGLGQNFSIGVVTGYLLDVDGNPNFGDRIDVKGRFNANIADVFGIEDHFDFYPGLDLSLKILADTLVLAISLQMVLVYTAKFNFLLHSTILKSLDMKSITTNLIFL